MFFKQYETIELPKGGRETRSCTSGNANRPARSRRAGRATVRRTRPNALVCCRSCRTLPAHLSHVLPRACRVLGRPAVAAPRQSIYYPVNRRARHTPLISSSLCDTGVPVTTHAWRRHRELAMTAATEEEFATSCASSSTTLQRLAGMEVLKGSATEHERVGHHLCLIRRHPAMQYHGFGKGGNRGGGWQAARRRGHSLAGRRTAGWPSVRPSTEFARAVWELCPPRRTARSQTGARARCARWRSAAGRAAAHKT